jgi:hypothetical protein
VTGATSHTLSSRKLLYPTVTVAARVEYEVVLARERDRHSILLDRVCLRLTQGDMVVQRDASAAQVSQSKPCIHLTASFRSAALRLHTTTQSDIDCSHLTLQES